MENQLNNLRELINNFRNNISEYTETRYDEYNTRSDFIDKFFFNLYVVRANKKNNATDTGIMDMSTISIAEQ